MRTAGTGGLVGLVVLQIVVLALPGVPTAEAGGYVFVAATLALAVLADVRSWALTWFVVLEGLLCLGAVVAAIGPTRNVGLGLLAALAVAAEALAVLQRRRQRRQAVLRVSV